MMVVAPTAMNPRMTMQEMSSMRVNPACLRIAKP
jgi:hypothetical protein